MRIALLAVLLLLQPQHSDRLHWVTNPRTATGSWVADPAHHLTTVTVAAIDSIIFSLARETSAEMAVVVLDSLDGLEPGPAALLLHRRWGVGKRERDNGIVFLWSPRLRRTHVSVGYGLEGVLIDSRVGRIQDQHVIPAFRRGDFNAGMLAGVRALAAAAREETYSGLPRVAAGRPGPEETGLKPSFWGFATFAAVFSFLFVALRRRFPRRCPHGHGWMHRLGETADNAHLEPEAQLEESLGSMDYDVWACGQCDARRVIPYKRFSARYRTCPRCKRRTCATKKKTLVEASYSSSGTREVTRSCRNCGFSDRREETIPKLTRSSSGSSGGGSSFSGGGGGGGGSSFGGGSAGGGGAGRGY